jgi:hypothetical protein
MSIVITNESELKAEDMNGIQKKAISYSSEMPCVQAPHYNEDILHSSSRWRITMEKELLASTGREVGWVPKTSGYDGIEKNSCPCQKIMG